MLHRSLIAHTCSECKGKTAHFTLNPSSTYETDTHVKWFCSLFCCELYTGTNMLAKDGNNAIHVAARLNLGIAPAPDELEGHSESSCDTPSSFNLDNLIYTTI